MAAAERRERHVRLIVPGETDAEETVNDFAKIYYVKAQQSPVFDKRYRIIMPWQYTSDDKRIRKILIDEKPDLVEVCDKYTISMMGSMISRGNMAVLKRPPIVHFSCERMDDNIASFMSQGSFGKWLARNVIRNYILPSFDYHIANSEYTAEEFFDAMENGGGRFTERSWNFFRAPRIPLKERIFVCPRGVNIDIFNPENRSEVARADMIERSGIPSDATIVLYAGRISPEKNVGLLVDMMKELKETTSKDIRLLVAGAGPKATWLQQQADTFLPGRIIQLGHLDKETLAGYYASADIFVHPNPKEPFGIAPLEAMASGVPVIAPNSGGILSYATNDNAWLMDPTGADFAAAVQQIIGDEQLLRSKTENAVNTARANTRERSTDRLFDTYDRIYEDFMRRRDLFIAPESKERINYKEFSKK